MQATAAVPTDLSCPRWTVALRDELEAPYMEELLASLEAERSRAAASGEAPFYPDAELILNAFAQTPFEEVRVVILGQDPYHGPGQAHGLAFSVRAGQRLPPSLRNIFRELTADIECAEPSCGDLTPWARSGVLLLNTALTVAPGRPGSHARRGWERFTDAAISALARQRRDLVFVLWGTHARAKADLIPADRHLVLRAPHPSPLSARRGFFGSRPFSTANAYLSANGQEPVEWRLP